MSVLADHERPARDAPPAAARAGRSSVAVARELAVAEGRRLLRHPAFVSGIVVTVLLLWLTSGDADLHWADWSVSVGLVLVPLGWLTIIATNLMAQRDRRHRVSELTETTPAPPMARTAGLTLATLATVPVTALVLAGSALHTWWRYDVIGSGPVLAELAVAPVLVVGGGVVGVAVARWLPRPVAAVAAVIAVIQMQVWMTQSVTAPTRRLAFWVDADSIRLPQVMPRPAEWHLLWLAAWTVVLAVVALARHGMRRSTVAVVTAALVAAGVAGWAQTRPPSEGDLAVAASVLTEPEQHQVCETHGPVTYCAYPRYRDLIGRWRTAVDGVLAAVPPSSRSGLEVRQRIATVLSNPDCQPRPALEMLPPEVADRVAPIDVWPRDGAVHPAIAGAETGPCGGAYDDSGWVFTAVAAGAWAVGLPPAPWGDDTRCAADGEARSAVALWLGAQGVPGGPDRLRRLREDHALFWTGRVEFGAHWDNPPQWGVAWHLSDLDAALALLDRPDDEVRALVVEHWDRLIDPATTTPELRTLAGIGGGRLPARPLATCPQPPGA